VPRAVVPILLEPLIASFCQAFPEVEVEIAASKELVDIAAEGFDAGIRLGQFIAADMVAVRLTPPFPFVVVGSPEYLRRRRRPERIDDLRQHACLRMRRSNRSIAPWSFVNGNKHDRAELANVPATHGFALEAFVAAFLRASSKKSSGPAPSGEHVNRDAAKGLRGAGLKVDAGDVRRIRQLIERYNPEILPEELRPAPLALPPVALSLSNNVVRLRGSED
jgi:hypothetical protein